MNRSLDLENQPSPESSDSGSSHVLLERVDQLRQGLSGRFHDEVVQTLYDDARRIADRSVRHQGPERFHLGEHMDKLITHPILGLPIMGVLLAIVFWLTVTGANIPSAIIAGALMQDGGIAAPLEQYMGITSPAWMSVSLYQLLHNVMAWAGSPLWLTGLSLDGVYLSLAWVISVMLPPMMIFFPMFTLLEDLGYLPRVAFNLDWMFKKAGAHGKQALTMSMGFGCNAAGVIACRVIDSPREKLVAILTNNFVPCNGRFPTLIMIATLFVATRFPPAWSSVAAAGTVVAVVLLGVMITLLVSGALTRTALKGEPSAFTLELPPYRRPAFLQVIYTSIIDRTIFVLARACWVAAPAGALIWILGNVNLEGQSLAAYGIRWLDPMGQVMGLDGVILLAYLIAIPANEIVVPVMLMLYMQHNRMIELENQAMSNILLEHGWSMLTAICLMLFCLLHNPCGTTIWTIWRETRSRRWTIFATLMPLVLGIIACTAVATIARFF